MQRRLPSQELLDEMLQIVGRMLDAGIYPKSRNVARYSHRNTLNDVEGLALKMVLTDLLREGLRTTR